MPLDRASQAVLLALRHWDAGGDMWCLLAFVGVLLTALSAIPQARYGAFQDPRAVIDWGGWPLPYGLPAIFVLLHVAKVLMPAVATLAWSLARPVWAFISLFAFFALLCVSVSNTASLFALERAIDAAERRAAAQRQSDMRTELDAIGKRLLIVGWARPSAQVDADVAAGRRSRLWDLTAGCTRLSTADQRRHCADIDRLAGERAAASEAEALRARELELRRRSASSRATVAGPAPDLVVFTWLLGMSTEGALMVRVIVIAIIIELVEGLLLALAVAIGRTIPKDAPASLAPQPPPGGPAPGGGPPEAPGSEGESSAPTTATSGDVVSNPPDGGRPTDPTSDATTCNTAAARGDRPSSTSPPATAISRAPGRSAARSYEPPSRACRLPTIAERAAVMAFVALLPKGAEFRAEGAPLFEYYEVVRRREGWPLVPRARFGLALKEVVEEQGGRKLKSSRQTYVGVGLPGPCTRTRDDVRTAAH